MKEPLESLVLALTAFATARTPGKVTHALLRGGRDVFRTDFEQMEQSERLDIEVKARSMHDRGIDAVLFGDADFPPSLVENDRPLVPVLFCSATVSCYKRKALECAARGTSQPKDYTPQTGAASPSVDLASLSFPAMRRASTLRLISQRYEPAGQRSSS